MTILPGVGKMASNGFQRDCHATLNRRQKLTQTLIQGVISAYNGLNGPPRILISLASAGNRVSLVIDCHSIIYNYLRSSHGFVRKWDASTVLSFIIFVRHKIAIPWEGCSKLTCLGHDMSWNMAIHGPVSSMIHLLFS